MAHGFSATRHMVADKYAEVFHKAGLAVLLYDHRGFGDSGDEPRLQINPWIQARGYRERGGEIVRVLPHTYSVPSCTGADTYVVRLDRGTCECRILESMV